MAILLLNISKLFGMAGIIAVAANTFALLRFHRRRLASFENPIDESQELIASFPIDNNVDGDGFFFAVGTTSALLEKDTWLKFNKVEDSFHQEEMESGPQDSSQSNSFKPEINLKTKSIDKWESSEETENTDKNGEQKTRNPSVVDVDEVLENLEKKQFSRQKKSCHEPLLDEWELINVEQTVDKEQEPHEHRELQGNVVDKGEKLDPALGLIKGLETLKPEQKAVVLQTNVDCVEEKPSLWYNLDEELQLAKESNATVFCLRIEWSKIMPKEPIDGVEKAINHEALDHYRWFIERIHAHGLRVMLTLFHRSLPAWASTYGGWQKDKTVDYFLDYTRVVGERFCDLVDFWITFNEPHVFALTEYCSGIQANLFQAGANVFSWRVFKNVMKKMAAAHLGAYDTIHDMREKTSRKVSIGIAHHISFRQPYGFLDISAVEFSNWMTQFTYVDIVCRKLDFLGINYYGQEFISSFGLKLVENEEYSESGEGVYPDGLYRELLDFHNRYKKLNIPFIITENAIADATDHLRKPYILEHLLAVKAAMNKGVPVRGYCYSALSDNLELANEHSLKLGLASFDLESKLNRVPRSSYYVFAEVAKSGLITAAQRNKAWAELLSVVKEENLHVICLGVGHGNMEKQVVRPYVQKDWRFGHYKPEGLRDPLSSILRCIWSIATQS